MWHLSGWDMTSSSVPVCIILLISSVNLYHSGVGDLNPVLWCCWPDFSLSETGLAVSMLQQCMASWTVCKPWCMAGNMDNGSVSAVMNFKANTGSILPSSYIFRFFLKFILYLCSVRLAGQETARFVGPIVTWTAGQTMTWAVPMPSAER